MYVYLWIPAVKAGHNLGLSAFKLFAHFPHGLLIQDCSIVRGVLREQVARQVLLKPLVFPDRGENNQSTQTTVKLSFTIKPKLLVVTVVKHSILFV